MTYEGFIFEREILNLIRFNLIRETLTNGIYLCLCSFGDILHPWPVRVIPGSQMRHIIENCENLIIITLTNWIVLMIMALCTFKTQT